MNNYKKGLIAEDVALKYLESKKYKLLAKRFKKREGEIDLIMIKDKTIIFCEIKTSHNVENLYYYLKPHQILRIINAAKLWLFFNQQYNNYDMRFDLILTKEEKIIEHIENAWQEN